MKTEAAKTAQAIKKDLKAKFPGVAFSVKSENYAGGNSVDISYKATRETPAPKAIQEIVGKYQFGHFDGMQDLYEYSNTREDIPQAKFVFVNPDTRELRQEIEGEALRYWGVEGCDDAGVRQKLNMWKDQAVYRYIQERFGW